MASPSDLVRAADERIKTELNVDVGLDAVLGPRTDESSSVEPPSLAESIRSLQRELAERSRVLDEARTRIAQLSATLAHQAEILPFTDDGWPERRAALAEQLTADPEAGVLSWLDHWFEAAAGMRTAALRQLRIDVALPSPWALLADRALAAEQGLSAVPGEPTDHWASVAVMLGPGIAGVTQGERRIPSVSTSEALRLLLVRVALHYGRLREAQSLLEPAMSSDHAAAPLALQARGLRRSGDAARADGLVDDAQERDPRDLDVTVELIERARRADDLSAAMNAARAAVDALLSTSDLDSDLAPLVDVPAELRVGAAERCAREGDQGRSRELLARALATAPAADVQLRAFIGESQAASAESAGEQRVLLIAAGDRRLEAGQPAKARADFLEAAALAVAGPHDELDRQAARVRWADTVAVLSWPHPMTAVRGDLEAALAAVVEARHVLPATGPDSWFYLTEGTLRLQLARDLGPHRTEHLWAGLLVVSRSIALEPADYRRWAMLADLAGELDMYRFADLAVEQAIAHQPDDIRYRSARVQAAINVGRYELALDEIDTVLAVPAVDDDIRRWLVCARGYALARLDRHAEAVAVLAGARLDSEWRWAWGTYAGSLAILGELERARQVCADYVTLLADRPGERTAAWASMFADRIGGRFDESRNKAEQMVATTDGTDGQALSELAFAQVLAGDRSGWDRLIDDLIHGPGVDYVHGRENYEFRLLAALAQAYGRPPIDFEPYRNADLGLDPGRTPLAAALAELHHNADEEGVETATVRPSDAAALAEAVVLSRQPDQTAALAGVLDRLATDADFAVEVTALRASAVDAPAPAVADVPGPPASRSSIDADDLSGTSFPVDQSLVLELPASWFAGLDDPLTEHPIFTRYLPELRARVPWDIPSVRVSARTELDPDRYRLLTKDGTGLASGAIDADLRYELGPAGALVPASVGTAGPAAELRTMSAAEAVIRRFGDDVRSSTDAGQAS